jgi:hypothetical protein
MYQTYQSRFFFLPETRVCDFKLCSGKRIIFPKKYVQLVRMNSNLTIRVKHQNFRPKFVLGLLSHPKSKFEATPRICCRLALTRRSEDEQKLKKGGITFPIAYGNLYVHLTTPVVRLIATLWQQPSLTLPVRLRPDSESPNCKFARPSRETKVTNNSNQPICT